MIPPSRPSRTTLSGACVTALAAAFLCSETAAADVDAEARSILAAHCVKCHGPTKQKGKLRVDSLEALLQGGKKGPALVPGSPEKSSIVQRVKLPLSDDRHMPPSDEPQLDGTELDEGESALAL